MSERIRGSYDDALYKSTYFTLLYYWTVLVGLSALPGPLKSSATRTCGSRNQLRSVESVRLATGMVRNSPEITSKGYRFPSAARRPEPGTWIMPYSEYGSRKGIECVGLTCCGDESRRQRG